jgi:murein DD-endopeptidase MepM/ murein hydrolase activator NlpD
MRRTVLFNVFSALSFCIGAKAVIAGGPLIPSPATVSSQDAQRLRGTIPASGIHFAWPLCAEQGPGFGYRVDPFTGRVSFHSGVDIGDAFGLEIRASAKGQVIAAERRGPYGLMVELDHGSGYRTRYAQLQTVLVKLADTVDAGTIIARTGSSGRSTGPHLHFEIWFDDRAWDPEKLLEPKAGC